MRQQYHLDPFEEWLIHHKARQLVGKAGITKSDLGDIKQDLRTDVINRLASFDPSKASRHTFVAMVIEHCLAGILEYRRAAIRNFRREQYSLNSKVRRRMGKPVERHQLMAERRQGRSEEQLCDLVNDVQAVVAGLSKDLQAECAQLLAGKTRREAARALGMGHTTLYRRLDRIEAAFKHAGLERYFQKS